MLGCGLHTAQEILTILERKGYVARTALGPRPYEGLNAGRPWLEQLTDPERSLVEAFFEKPYSWRDFFTALARAAGVEVPEAVNAIKE